MMNKEIFFDLTFFFFFLSPPQLSVQKARCFFAYLLPALHLVEENKLNLANILKLSSSA